MIPRIANEILNMVDGDDLTICNSAFATPGPVV